MFNDIQELIKHYIIVFVTFKLRAKKKKFIFFQNPYLKRTFFFFYRYKIELINIMLKSLGGTEYRNSNLLIQ